MSTLEWPRSIVVLQWFPSLRIAFVVLETDDSIGWSTEVRGSTSGQSTENCLKRPFIFYFLWFLTSPFISSMIHFSQMVAADDKSNLTALFWVGLLFRALVALESFLKIMLEHKTLANRFAERSLALLHTYSIIPHCPSPSHSPLSVSFGEEHSIFDIQSVCDTAHLGMARESQSTARARAPERLAYHSRERRYTACQSGWPPLFVAAEVF